MYAQQFLIAAAALNVGEKITFDYNAVKTDEIVKLAYGLLNMDYTWKMRKINNGIIEYERIQ